LCAAGINLGANYGSCKSNREILAFSGARPSKGAALHPRIIGDEGDIARQQYGLDGTGVGIAVIDSGVFNHDDLKTANGLGSRIVYSESFIPGDLSINDVYGHGTHVAGIVAGNGHDSQSGYPTQYVGVAPNANIINLRVLDANGSGTDSQVIAAIQRAIQLKSTYNIRVGRSRKVTGPYLDKDGVDMLKAGGTLLLSNKGPLFGPGHAGILINNGKSWFTSDFEGDTRMGGKATLAIMPLTWRSGWPEVEVVDE